MTKEEDRDESENGDAPEGADSQPFLVGDEMVEDFVRNAGFSGHVEIDGCFEMSEHVKKVDGFDDGNINSLHIIYG